MACSTSHGVHVTLKDGSKVDGYMRWNHFYLDGFISDPEDKHMDQEPGESRQFERWIELAKPHFSDPGFGKDGGIRLIIYRSLRKINHPHEAYVGIAGEVREFKWNEVADMTPAPDLPLVVDTTGIDVLTREDADRLANEMPRFSVENVQGVGARVYVVYGSSVTLEEVLSHVVHENAEDLEEVSVDGVRVINKTPGAPPAGSTVEENKASSDEGLRLFREKYKSYDGEVRALDHRCERDLTDLRGGPVSIVTGKRTHEPAPVLERAKSKECRLKKTALTKRYWTSLGSKDELHRRGIILYAYGWD